MNQWVLVFTAIIPVGTMAFFFVPLILLIPGLIGALITIVAVISIWKIAPKLMPIRLMIYTDKHGGISLDFATRAKRVKDKAGKYWLECSDGFRIPDPGRKYEISGANGRVLNLYTNNYTEFHPYKFTVDKDKLEAKLIPVEHRQWLADQMEATMNVTQPPEKWYTKLVPWLPAMIMGFTAMMMLVIFMNSFPEFAQFFC